MFDRVFRYLGKAGTFKLIRIIPMAYHRWFDPLTTRYTDVVVYPIIDQPFIVSFVYLSND